MQGQESVERAQRRLTPAMIIGYCICLFAIWALREFFVRQRVSEWLGEWGGVAFNTATKLLVWTAPALWLVRRYPEDMMIPKLFAQPVRWRRVLPVAAGLMLLAVLSALITLKGRLAIQPGFRPSALIGTVLFVGITEEAVFRGFLLNTFSKRMKEGTALVVSSFLFVLIHFPIWYTNGLFGSMTDVLRSSLSIFVLGIVFGITFVKEENLIAPIVLHMAWNLPALLLHG